MRCEALVNATRASTVSTAMRSLLQCNLSAPRTLWTGSHELGHKHRLHDNFEHRIACCGGDASSVAHFWPRCWELSSKAQRECAKIALTRAYSEWSQCACNEADAKAAADDQRPLEPLWIVKPINLSRGLGIRLVSQWEEISQDELSGSLIQR